MDAAEQEGKREGTVPPDQRVLLKRTGLPWFVKAALIAAGVLCAAAAVLYALGSGMGDHSAFLLLKILRCLSFALSVVSFCALAFSVRLMIRRPSVKQALFLVLYAVLVFLGVLLLFLNDLIVALSEGNG